MEVRQFALQALRESPYLYLSRHIYKWVEPWLLRIKIKLTYPSHGPFVCVQCIYKFSFMCKFKMFNIKALIRKLGFAINKLTVDIFY
ncbi:hypothetical protein XELAEV_18013243mg [Xenopus laevis]|uniref:Uncharacterized protein n=1 Tax=Xenopus laevis TaxID=8355 RepID=A0A974DRB5_XENLA|nr:hypothetical protein XELAEV_18013243mg [Xenopus laevis]